MRIKITVKSGRKYEIENVPYVSFREMANLIKKDGLLLIFDDIAISIAEIEAIEKINL